MVCGCTGGGDSGVVFRICATNTSIISLYWDFLLPKLSPPIVSIYSKAASGVSKYSQEGQGGTVEDPKCHMVLTEEVLLSDLDETDGGSDNRKSWIPGHSHVTG